MREVENIEGIIGAGLGVAAYGMVNAAQGIGEAIGSAIAQSIRNRRAYNEGYNEEMARIKKAADDAATFDRKMVRWMVTYHNALQDLEIAAAN
jgi:hypothetical protein